jgi:rubrerythrin
MRKPGSRDALEEIFRRAVEIERAAAGIYTRFSQLFSHLPEISAFWLGLAEDEMQHANTLRDVCELLTSEQLASPCDIEISERVAAAQRMVREDSPASVKNLDDAYEVAHELEFSEVNAVFKLLATAFVPSEERRQFVVEQITQHQQKLVDFGRGFGDRGSRKAIAIRDG